jgi:hypothetical protein
VSGAWKGYRRAEHDVESFIIPDYYSFIFFLSVCPFLDVTVQDYNVSLGIPFPRLQGNPLYGLEYLAFGPNSIVQNSDGRVRCCVV